MASSSSFMPFAPIALVFFLFLGSSSAQLSTSFYSSSCPNLFSAIRPVVESAIAKEKRMGASLLRLFFHDCFVNGCDASLLLDDTSSFKGEKTATPNNQSARGFDVIDKIKAAVEKACPGVVSCADIIAVTARDSVVTLGGPNWDVKLGRRDARTASFSGANNNIPPPTSSLSNLISKFSAQGLSTKDMVALAEKDCATVSVNKLSTFPRHRSSHNWASPVHKFQSPRIQRHRHRHVLGQVTSVQLPEDFRLRRQQPGPARPPDPGRIRQQLLQEPRQQEGPAPLRPRTVQRGIDRFTGEVVQRQPGHIQLGLRVGDDQDGGHQPPHRVQRGD